MIRGLPQWWGPALMVPGFVLLALVGFYMAGRHLSAAIAAGEAGPGRSAPNDDGQGGT